MVNWDDLKLLLAVSRRGSFLQAGVFLGMAASTLSRRITKLEQAIGEPVVERGVDGVRLTARGAILVETAEQLERELVQRSIAQGGELSGRVSVSSGDGFVPIVTEAMGRYTSLNPSCSVDYFIDASFLKISRGGVDIGIRTVNLGEPSLIYRRVGCSSYGIYCSKATAQKLGKTPNPSKIGVIDLTPPLDQIPQAQALKAVGFKRILFRVSSFSAQLDAVRSGYGVAALPDLLAIDLVRVFNDIELPPLEVYLVTRPQALRQPHIRAFFDILQEVMRPYSQ